MGEGATTKLRVGDTAYAVDYPQDIDAGLLGMYVEFGSKEELVEFALDEARASGEEMPLDDFEGACEWLQEEGVSILLLTVRQCPEHGAYLSENAADGCPDCVDEEFVEQVDALFASPN